MVLLLILLSFVIASLLCIVVKQRPIIEALSVAVAAFAFIGSVRVAFDVASSGVYAPFPLFSVDALGAIVMLIIGGVGLVVTVYSVAYLRRETAKGIIGLARTRQFLLCSIYFWRQCFGRDHKQPDCYMDWH